jgi:hypothetical protein
MEEGFIMLRFFGVPIIIFFVLAAGCDSGPEYKFIQSAKLGDAEAIESMLNSGFSPNVKNRSGRTALMEAASVGQGEIVKLLLQRGADTNAQDKDGRTALMRAAITGQTDIAQLLVARQADVNIKSRNGETALSLARDKSHPETVEFLEMAGAKE